MLTSWPQRSSQLACCRAAPGPLRFSCLSSSVSSLQCQPLLALPAAKLPPSLPACLFVWFPAIWRPHWVPRATQPLGNSNRWGGTASLTDGLTEAGLLQHSSLGNRRQELSHHGCLLNRGGGGQSFQPGTDWGYSKRDGLGGAGQLYVSLLSSPSLLLRTRIIFGSGRLGFAWHWDR